MDTSEYYRKMADCPEIQDGWEPKKGDWYTCWMDDTRVSDIPHWSKGLVIGRYKPFNREGYKRLWLPRQDQLQEMANQCGCTDPMCLHLCFHKWFIKLPNPAPPYTDSFEQLWLAFVMADHNKTWDGETWVWP